MQDMKCFWCLFANYLRLFIVLSGGEELCLLPGLLHEYAKPKKCWELLWFYHMGGPCAKPTPLLAHHRAVLQNASLQQTESLGSL